MKHINHIMTIPFLIIAFLSCDSQDCPRYSVDSAMYYNINSRSIELFSPGHYVSGETNKYKIPEIWRLVDNCWAKVHLENDLPRQSNISAYNPREGRLLIVFISGESWEWDGMSLRNISAHIDLPNEAFRYNLIFNPVRNRFEIYDINNDDQIWFLEGHEWYSQYGSFEEFFPSGEIYEKESDQTAWCLVKSRFNTSIINMALVDDKGWQILGDGGITAFGSASYICYDGSEFIVIVCEMNRYLLYRLVENRFIETNSVGAPSYLYGSEFAYDPDNNRMIMYGGKDYSGIRWEVYKTWEIKYNADLNIYEWKEL